jgi:hypothetical protein
MTEQMFTITNLPPAPPKPDIYLSDLIPEKHRADCFDLTRDTACFDGFQGEGMPPIRMADDVYKKGLGLHSDAETVFALKPEYARFVAVVGIDDCTGNKGNMFFKVMADDKLLAESPILSGSAQRLWRFDCPIPAGAKRLTLLSLAAPDSGGYNMGNWADAGFVLKK